MQRMLERKVRRLIRGLLRGMYSTVALLVLMVFVLGAADDGSFIFVGMALLSAAGAGLYFFRRQYAKNTFANRLSQALAKYRARFDFSQMDWRDFEFLVAKILSDQGHHVEVTRGSQDGGVDVFAKSPKGEIFVVQCKHWQSSNVGVAAVREIVGAIKLHQANKAIIATSGGFTKGAIKEAEQLGVTLLDGQAINKMASKDLRKSGGVTLPGEGEQL